MRMWSASSRRCGVGACGSALTFTFDLALLLLCRAAWPDVLFLGWNSDTVFFFHSDNGADPVPSASNTDPTAVERGRPTAPQMGGSNWPHRGIKFTASSHPSEGAEQKGPERRSLTVRWYWQSWEGGVHVPAFIVTGSGQGLPQGAEHDALFHVTDIFPVRSLLL